MNDINKRLKTFLDENNISQQDFAEKIGSTQPYVSAVLNGKRKIGTNLIERILEEYPQIDKIHFIKGENTLVSGVINLKTIPLYDAEASAGYGSFNDMLSKEKAVGEFVIPVFGQAEWMIYVKGSSMYPKYSSGDIVACKEIKESRFIQWNKVYVLATKEQGLLVKRLMPSEKENHIKVISDNREYPAYDVPNDEIVGVALVLGVIRLE